MSATDPTCRRPPTPEEIITSALSGQGGCCINLNYFAHLVFSTLGLDSFLIQSTHANAPVAGTHCMIGVKLGPGGASIYVVELGGAFPILEPIPMQGLPFRITSAAGWPYEFREIQPGTVARFQLDGGLLTGKYVRNLRIYDSDKTTNLFLMKLYYAFAVRTFRSRADKLGPDSEEFLRF